MYLSFYTKKIPFNLKFLTSFFLKLERDCHPFKECYTPVALLAVKIVCPDRRYVGGVNVCLILLSECMYKCERKDGWGEWCR